MSQLRRFIVEYVGNLHYFVRPDRRSDRRARELMNWAHRQMEARSFEAPRKQELVDNLRQVLGSRDAPS